MAKGIAEDSEGHISHPGPRALMLLRRGGPLGRFWGLGLMTTAEKKKANIKAKRLDFRSPKPQASMLVASGRGRRRRAGEATDGCRHCLEPVSETRETVSSAGQCTRNRPGVGLIPGWARRRLARGRHTAARRPRCLAQRYLPSAVRLGKGGHARGLVGR